VIDGRWVSEVPQEIPHIIINPYNYESRTEGKECFAHRDYGTLPKINADAMWYHVP